MMRKRRSADRGTRRTAHVERAIACLAALLTACLTNSIAAADESETSAESTVGIPGMITDIVLPAPEVVVREVDPDTAPIVLRIAEVSPHGNAFRYDLEFVGMEAGEHHLKDYLARRDGSSTDDLPDLAVMINAVLPADQTVPGDLEPVALPRFGGYRTALVLGTVIWVVGLLAIIFVGRRGRHSGAGRAAPRPLTLSEQLRPLLNQAIHTGTLSPEQKGQLDLLIVTWFRQRRDLMDVPHDEAIRRLRDDAQAGPLVTCLEKWCYGRTTPSDDEVRDMLKPLDRHMQEASE